jgi:hypothetical protein
MVLKRIILDIELSLVNKIHKIYKFSILKSLKAKIIKVSKINYYNVKHHLQSGIKIG